MWACEVILHVCTKAWKGRIAETQPYSLLYATFIGHLLGAGRCIHCLVDLKTTETKSEVLEVALNHSVLWFWERPSHNINLKISLVHILKKFLHRNMCFAYKSGLVIILKCYALRFCWILKKRLRLWKAVHLLPCSQDATSLWENQIEKHQKISNRARYHKAA